MNAYVGLVAHPFFAVTTADGTFEIKGLPPGPTRSKRGTSNSAPDAVGHGGRQDPAKSSFAFKSTTNQNADTQSKPQSHRATDTWLQPCLRCGTVERPFSPACYARYVGPGFSPPPTASKAAVPYIIRAMFLINGRESPWGTVFSQPS